MNMLKVQQETAQEERRQRLESSSRWLPTSESWILRLKYLTGGMRGNRRKGRALTNSTNLIFLVRPVAYHPQYEHYHPGPPQYEQYHPDETLLRPRLLPGFTTTFSKIIIDFLPSDFTVIAITRSRISERLLSKHISVDTNSSLFIDIGRFFSVFFSLLLRLWNFCFVILPVP